MDRLWRSRGFTLPQFELTPLEFDPPAYEPSGELHPSIERHVRTAWQCAPIDPAEELRSALCELRRSLA